MLQDVKVDKRHWILDYTAARWAIGDVGTPKALRSLVWSLVDGLHGVEHNKRGSLCGVRVCHHEDPLTLCETRVQDGGMHWCPDCLARWVCKCGDEPEPFVWCSDCQG